VKVYLMLEEASSPSTVQLAKIHPGLAVAATVTCVPKS